MRKCRLPTKPLRFPANLHQGPSRVLWLQVRPNSLLLKSGLKRRLGPKRKNRKLPVEVLYVPLICSELSNQAFLMAIFKPFKAFRPQSSIAQAVASKPYDVLDSREATAEAEGNPHSFLRVIKPEIELSPDTDPYSDEVYEKGRENFLKFCKDGVFTKTPRLLLSLPSDHEW